MSEQKHTPGPWTIIPATSYAGDDGDLEGAYTSPAGIEGANGDPVCAFGIAEGSGHLFENEADYHLISAAPDFIDAARDIVASRSSTFKARNGRDVSIQDDSGEMCWIVPFDEMLALESAIAKAEGRQP